MYLTRKTFVQKDGGIPLKVKFVIYILYQIILILLVSQLLALIAAGLYHTFCGSIIGDFSAMAAKILVTPLTMCMNFLDNEIIDRKDLEMKEKILVFIPMYNCEKQIVRVLVS